MDFKIYAFYDGNMACFNEKGEQIVELQKYGWLEIWLNYAESIGYDPTGWEIELPDCIHKAKVFKTNDGHFNWEII